MRVRQHARKWLFEIARVEWTGHEPCTVWYPYRTWITPPPAARLARTKESALADRRAFPLCRMCDELQLRGQMHRRDVCHGCAEQFLGIVH
jgi:hypothetical protein